MLIAAVGVLAGLVSPAIAAAGTYEVKACDAADGKNNSWRRINNAVNYETADTCPSDGEPYKGLYAGTRASGTTSRGSFTGWRFTAPKDTTLKSLDYELGWYKRRDGDSSLSTNKRLLRSYPSSANNFQRDDGSLDLDDAEYVQAVASCGAQGSCEFDADVAAIALNGATVEVEDLTDPELNAKGGSLSRGTGPVQSGLADIVFDATDNTGIKSARVLVDGDEIHFEAFEYDETRNVPAENQTDERLVVDTRRLSEGPHTVRLVVVDSGGNEQSYEKSILVDNVTGEGSSDDGERRGGGGRSSGGGSGGGGGSGSNGSGSGPGIVSSPVGLDTVSLATSSRLVQNGRSVLFTGRVLDGGLPAGNVLVAVQARVGRRWVTFKIVRSDALGNFASRYRFKRTRRSTRYEFRAHVAAQGTLSTVDSLSRLVRVGP